MRRLRDIALGLARRLIRAAPLHAQNVRPTRRGPVTHVIILDGTMSSLRTGRETNAGLTYKLLLRNRGAALSLYYEAGVQWSDWTRTGDVVAGRGINRQIRRAYGYLASRYRPGDRIFLFGYSRGAFAARSLAGLIGRIGLLRPEKATVRNVRTAYRHYRTGGQGRAARAFARARCHEAVEIEMLGLWDTVKALGLGVPLLWRAGAADHDFHDHHLGPHVKAGYHALARDETRKVYTPVLWDTAGLNGAQVEQVWFRGTHGDVGGQLDGLQAARPLSNIPLVWILERAEARGLPLPEDWRADFPCDPAAPSIGTWRGWAKLFVLRGPRQIGADPSERLHETALHDPAPPPDAAPAV
ncbi:DUF2235 domain-containing protein [Roseovarius aestuariivivens]|uniref:DUF2235 domain-containing protein n=1 Tax=Roseovarius aestuariivivens TaxID=1888910 RepID=UPI001081DDC7|nr:DUF2235 domain-containing protein [Roseovarius aestuariivivens]